MMTASALARVYPTVLVVDDYPDTRAVLRRAMEARGCVVAEAVNGEAAVEAARVVCPDLILMDLNMPRMDGLMATQRIRELKGACDEAVIIALTAFDTYGIKEAALAAGCDDYLTKPVEISQLDLVLKRLLPLWF